MGRRLGVVVVLLAALDAWPRADAVVFKNGPPCLHGRRGSTREEIIKDDWACFTLCRPADRSPRCRRCCLDTEPGGPPDGPGGPDPDPSPEPGTTEGSDPTDEPPETEAATEAEGATEEQTAAAGEEGESTASAPTAEETSAAGGEEGRPTTEENGAAEETTP